MELLAAILLIGLISAKAALGATVIISLALLWNFAKEEWAEFTSMTREEKKRLKAWDEEMFTKWCREEKTRLVHTGQGLVRV
jgi:hypothetical protein